MIDIDIQQPRSHDHEPVWDQGRQLKRNIRGAARQVEDCLRPDHLPKDLDDHICRMGDLDGAFDGRIDPSRTLDEASHEFLDEIDLARRDRDQVVSKYSTKLGHHRQGRERRFVAALEPRLPFHELGGTPLYCDREFLREEQILVVSYM